MTPPTTPSTSTPSGNPIRLKKRISKNATTNTIQFASTDVRLKSQFDPKLLLVVIVIFIAILAIGYKLLNFSPAASAKKRILQITAIAQQWTTATPMLTATPIPTNTPLPTTTPLPTATPLPTTTPLPNVPHLMPGEIQITPTILAPIGNNVTWQFRELPPGFNPGWCYQIGASELWLADGSRQIAGSDDKVYLSIEAQNQLITVSFAGWYEQILLPSVCGQFAKVRK